MQKYDIFCACNVTSIIILTRNQYLNGMRYRINLDIIHITLALYLQCLPQVSIDYVRLNGFVVTRLNLKWYEWRIAITNLFIKEVKEDQMLRSSHAKNIHFFAKCQNIISNKIIFVSRKNVVLLKRTKLGMNGESLKFMSDFWVLYKFHGKNFLCGTLLIDWNFLHDLAHWPILDQMKKENL